jgi:hypothetical protein
MTTKTWRRLIAAVLALSLVTASWAWHQLSLTSSGNGFIPYDFGYIAAVEYDGNAGTLNDFYYFEYAEGSWGSSWTGQTLSNISYYWAQSVGGSSDTYVSAYASGGGPNGGGDGYCALANP